MKIDGSKVACIAGVFFKACDRNFAAILKFAVILTWEKWVGRGHYFSFQPTSHSPGRIFVSPQPLESKMALASSNVLARHLAKIRLHCRLAQRLLEIIIHQIFSLARDWSKHVT